MNQWARGMESGSVGRERPEVWVHSGRLGPASAVKSDSHLAHIPSWEYS